MRNASPVTFLPSRCAVRGHVATRLVCALSVAVLLAGCAPDSGPPAAVPATPASGEQLWWQESFDVMPSWESPSNASPSEVAMVLSIARVAEKNNNNNINNLAGDAGLNHYLLARHDAKPDQESRAPAVHFGKTWRDAAPPLDKACFLSWKWRARQHPAIKDDAWIDLAASVYVIVRMPGLFGGGRGFKFGWLAKPGSKGDKQRGLYQIAQRVGPVTDQWQTERVDLCSLYRSYYDASPTGEKVLYVGLVTDADNTESVAAADYDDFKLSRE